VAGMFRGPSCGSVSTPPPRGHRPQLFDAVVADADIPVRLTAASQWPGTSRILSPRPRRLVAAEMPRRPRSSEARS